MGIQLAERGAQIVQPLAREICPTTKPASGGGWAKIVTTASGNATDGLVMMAHHTALTLSNAATGPSFYTVSYVGVANHSLDFVAEIRTADAAEPEATFDNVVDMLDWLNRE